MAPRRAAAGEAAVAAAPPPHSVEALHRAHLKRTAELFGDEPGVRAELDESSLRRKLACKVSDEYAAVAHLPPPAPSAPAAAPAGDAAATLAAAAAAPRPAKPPRVERESAISKMLDTLPAASTSGAPSGGDAGALVPFRAEGAGALALAASARPKQQFSANAVRRMGAQWPRPDWHPPWKLYRVISGHLGWVRSVAVDPANEWFATGSADRTIKIWDLASGQLRLTLTGHIEQVTGLAISDRHPYMFSGGLDKQVKCWDLEYNKVIRQYHGHLSGIYSLALHPALDVLLTGARDSSCRVWDMRTKAQVFCLSGHDNTVCSILSQAPDPQVITGSHDATIKLWDLRTGRASSTLTHHKKSIRAMAMHPREFTFASASADNIKKFSLPQGTFLHNMLAQQRSIVNAMALNADGVTVTGGDNGSLWFWDWKSGNCFQREETIVQPGSMESESAVFASCFDATGSRLITCEADKTIKMWREDETATPESHPVVFKPPRDLRRY